ncbi:Uncharacterised protein [Chlamydia trachomatis]|nr:Uncharacterised protein [Chlamydia trachomatis]
MGFNTMCNYIFNFCMKLFGMIKIQLFCSARDRLGNAVRKMFLYTCSYAQSFIFTQLGKAQSATQLRQCFSKRACFIKDYGINIRESLKKLAAFYGNSIARSLFHSRSNGNRSRKFNGTRVIYHQYTKRLRNPAR